MNRAMGKRTQVLVAVAALGLAGGLCAAQSESKPNLTGEWKLNVGKSDFGPMPGPSSRTDKIDHKEPTLKIARTQVTAQGDTVTTEWSCTTDNKECSNNLPGGAVLKSTAKWDGEALVVESKANSAQGEVQIKDRWSLSKDGKTLTISRHLASPMGEVDQTFVLDKQ